MADLAATFRKPFGEQVAAWRIRMANLVPTARWDDLWQDQHNTGFMVAGAVKADLLADLAAAVDRAIVEGTGFEAFKKDFRAIVEKRGWHGWTGEGTARGEEWRMRTIYRTNMRTSYMAGRYAQLVDGNYKFWVYRHSGAAHPRLDHLSWDGVALPPDHPFWEAHYPPNGWGCGCTVEGARTERGIRRVGGDPGKVLPDGWQTIDKRTGAPKGIGKGWAYAPGRSSGQTIHALAEKTVNWPYGVARAYMDDLPDTVNDAFSTAFRELPSLSADLRRYAERAIGARNNVSLTSPVVEPLRTMGRLTTQQRAELANHVRDDLTNYQFILDASAVRHIHKVHGPQAGETGRGQVPIDAAYFGYLPRILQSPDRIEEAGRSDVGRPVVRFIKRIGDLIFFVPLEVRGRKRRMIAVQSMWARRVSAGPPT